MSTYNRYKVWLFTAFFCVLTLILGLAIYKKQSSLVDSSLSIGGSAVAFSPSIGSDTNNQTYQFVTLCVQIDDKNGYGPEPTNAYNNAVKFYKDWLPSAGTSTNSFYVLPQNSTLDSNSQNTQSIVRYAWFDSSRDALLYTNESDWNYAVVGLKKTPANYAGGIFKPKLKELFNRENTDTQAGGMKALLNWQQEFSDPSYVEKSISQWRYFAGNGTDGQHLARINEYMGIQDLDLNNIASWSTEQREEAFLSYLDLLLTCRYAVGYSGRASELWTNVINGYLNEGPKADVSNYNLVIYPALTIKCGRKDGNPILLTASDMDYINWCYSMKKTYDLSEKDGSKLVSGIENTGELDGLINQLNISVSRNTSALNKNSNEYMAYSDVGDRALANGVGLRFNFTTQGFTDPLGGSQGGLGLRTMWIQDKSGGLKYFGKNLILGIPLATSPLQTNTLTSKFKVYWVNDGGNYFETSESQQNVGDTAGLRISLECPKEDLASWDSICNTYEKFYLSFNIKSDSNGGGTDTSKPRHTETTKDKDGVTSPISNAEYTLDGTPYTLGTKIEITSEVLRKLIKGEMEFTRLYDKATNSQVIALSELETFGYDLNVTVYYEDKNGKGGTVTTPWTGWSYDTSSKDKEQHQVSVFRPNMSDSPKITWYSDPEAYAEIKEGTVDYEETGSHEAFEAMAGVPSTEMLYFASGGSEFIVELELEYVEGEEGRRIYESSFRGTECEFKHNDGFWEMAPKAGTETYKEHDLDTNIKSVAVKSPNADLQTGEHIISKFLVADETGQDIQPNYSNKTDVQWYKWAVAGTGGGTNSVSQNEVLSGHTHSYTSDNPEGDKNMSSSTVTATWTGTIKNDHNDSSQAPNSSYISGYVPESWSCACTGNGGTPGSFNETDTSWTVTDYWSAIDQAKKWAEAYEKTNDTYTAKMLADSDGFSRVWRIGNARIDISFSGGISNMGSGSRPADSYTTADVDTAKKEGNQANFGYNHSFTMGSPGSAGSCPTSGNPPVTNHSGQGGKCTGSSVYGVGDITYTIKVTFDNGTLDAHELCGTCCQHNLPAVYDYWIQKMKYDYARLNVCHVYKIYRSYVDGMEEITFADYNDADDIANGGDHEMYSGPIKNYTVDTGLFTSEDRFFSLDVRNKNRARQVITASEQAKRHNGTDTIVAAINQGDPNIFYNIGMMANVEDDAYHSYADEVENGQPSLMNSLAGRVRYSLAATSHHYMYSEEFTQRGNYNSYSGGSMVNHPDYYGEFMGTRSNKCDGMTQTVGSSNQVKVVANGHAKPTVSLGGEAGQWFSTYNSSQDLKNFSNGITYSRYTTDMGGIASQYKDTSGLGATMTFYYDKSNRQWYTTEDEYWMAITTTPDDYSCRSLVHAGTVENNGGGTYSGGSYTYSNHDIANNASPKTKYTANSIDYLDYQSEEYHRFRYRRNMSNTLYVISDMLILQTSTGDQSVMYHWKSQTKRAQQHYDYNISDVDLEMANFDSSMTGKNITLTEKFEDMWLNQHYGDRDAKSATVTMTAKGWGVNNVGTDGAINVGGYLGLYDQPDRKFSSGVNNNRIVTLFDGNPGGTSSASAGNNTLRGTQGNDYGWPSGTMGTFNETSTNYPIMWDYHYKYSPAGVNRFKGYMDFGANKGFVAKFVDTDGDFFSYTDADKAGTGVKFGGFSNRKHGPSNLWRYATTVDNPNPDMYKSMAGSHGANWGENGDNYWRASGLRMQQPSGALRIVTDKIQQDPTNPNRKYETGTAIQTYMQILDWPNTDIGEMNYVDITKRGGPGNIHRYDFTKRNRTFKSKFVKETINVTDEDRKGNDYEDLLSETGHLLSKKDYATMPGYTLEAVYSKAHNKVNDIVVHTPISVENSVIVHNLEAEHNNWYADTRTDAEDITTSALEDKLEKLEVCSGDPDTCAFKVLKCQYGEDKVLFSSDFDTGIIKENGKTYVTNLADTNYKYALPDGFEVTHEIKWYSEAYGVLVDGPKDLNGDGVIDDNMINNNINPTGFTASCKDFLACFGTRWSLPLADLGITYSTDTQIKVDMDFYMNNSKDRGTMVVSFYGYDFYIPGDRYNGIPTWNTGNGWERKYSTVDLRDTEFKLSLIFDFADVYNSKFYLNGVLINNVQIVNNSNTITQDKIFGGNASLNIGSWGYDDKYPARFYIDNLKITELSKGKAHTDECYQIVKEHEKAQEYTCGISYTYEYGKQIDNWNADRPYIFTAPQTGVYRVEAWGAVGGGGTVVQGAASAGGAGGYARGYINLTKGEQIMVYPGGAGNSEPTTTTGIEYFWVLTTDCGNSSAWIAANPETMSGITYVNSVTGKEEGVGITLHGVWAETCPTGFTCSQHSVSVAMKDGKMVQRVKGANSTPVTTESSKTYTVGEIGWMCTDGQYHTVVFDPEQSKTITLYSSHKYIIGYHSDGCGYPGSTYYPNNWGHLKDLTTGECLSCGHTCAFDTTKYPSYTLNLYAKPINKNGDAGFTRVPSTTNTFAGAGFNGGGASGLNGYGGGGASDIRRLNAGGLYVLKGSSNASVETMEYGGKTYIKVFDHDVTVGGLFKSTNEAMNCNVAGRYSILNAIDNYKSDGKYQFMLYYPETGKRNIWKQTNNPLTENIANTDTGSKVKGYEAVEISMTGNYWGGLAKSTTTATLLDGSVGHGYWFYAVGATSNHPAGNTTIPGGDSTNVNKVQLWMVCDESAVADMKAENPGKAMMADTGALVYGPYDTATQGTYQVDIYGSGLSDCTFDVYDNAYGGVIYTHDKLLDLKISPTHVSFYFDLKVDCVAETGKGLEVRIHHDNAPVFSFNEMYISRLEDRVIVAGGGGGADNAGGTAGGADDGSGGTGGGLTGGNAKVEGVLTKPGVALSAKLQAEVDKIKDSNGAWKAIGGIAMSGCGLGGGQDYGYALGRGESVSFNTDTGGAGGGYYGGFVTNHNNGGAGGGSGYLSSELSDTTLTGGVNTKQGKVRIGLVSHENAETLTQSWGYTGNVQTWTVPETGEYRLEVWGAQGGKYTSGYEGGKGGYATGIYTLYAGQTVYINVGQKGYDYPQNHTSGAPFNGGGQGYAGGGDGGGASDFRIGGNSLLDRIIVAGAGGGSDLGGKGGVGGNEVGGSSSGTYESSDQGHATGGTQTSGGTGGGATRGYGGQLGIGGGKGDNAANDASFDAAGGGGGYYGGAAGWGGQSGGAGGSSYIKGVRYGQLIDGGSMQPGKVTSSQKQLGNSGNGYARITKINRSHNSTCTFKNSEYNYHEHRLECFYDGGIVSSENLNPTLKGALINDYYGNTNELRTLLGSEVYDLLHSGTEKALMSLNGFTEANFKGLRLDAYGNDSSGYGTGTERAILTCNTPANDVGGNGELILIPNATDSWVALDTNINAGAVTKITARVKYEGVEPGFAQLFWKTAKQNYTGTNQVRAVVEPGGAWQTITWYLDGNGRYNADGTPKNPEYSYYSGYVNWKDTITGLRFDLIGNNQNAGKVYIKDITFYGKSGSSDMNTMNTLNVETFDFTQSSFGASKLGTVNMSKTSDGLTFTGRFYGDEVILPLEAQANSIQFVTIDFKVNSIENINTNHNVRLYARGSNGSYVGLMESSINRTWKPQYDKQTISFFVGDLWRGKDIKSIVLDLCSGDVIQNGSVTLINMKLYGYLNTTQKGQQETHTFNYTGGVQSFTPSKTASYLLEVWGAQGGDGRTVNTTTINSGSGGKGGYSKGYATLTAGQTYYIYVGGKGGEAGYASLSYGAGGYNGGGCGGTELSGESYPENGAGGGGMTHISTVGTDNLKRGQTISSGTQSWNYGYTGGVQSFTAPQAGTYTLEVWGAAGGGWGNHDDMKGGYSKGTVNLSAGQTIYIVCGGAGACAGHASGTHHNGSGTGYNGGASSNRGGGGGATSITTTNRGVLKNFASYTGEVLIVAGGGGSNGYWGYTGEGGGTSGGNSASTRSGTVSYSTGGTQTGTGSQGNPGGFGYGGSGANDGGAGGGGWYGGSGAGAGGGVSYNAGGGGGSGYIGGVSNGTTTTGGGNRGNGSAKITLNSKSVSDNTTYSFNPSGVLIAAGGGGGASGHMDSAGSRGGNGGGTSGETTNSYTTAGTQSSGYTRQGLGANGYSHAGTSNYGSTGGGGGGWYGGNTSTTNNSVAYGGAGGSGYIGKVTGGSTQTGVQSGNGKAVISIDLPTTIDRASGQQKVTINYASSFVTDINNLDGAVTQISQYTDGSTNNVGPTIPRELNGLVNPIYYCYAYGYNKHVCTEICDKETKVLKCMEPHHENMHYETTEQAIAAALAKAQQGAVNAEQQRYREEGRIFTDTDYMRVIDEATQLFYSNDNWKNLHSCYEACNNDANHKKHDTTTVVNGNRIGDIYINTDEYFDIWFPNTGDFAENPSLHGIHATVETRGMGYEDGMDTGHFVYPVESQNFGSWVSWVRERYVKFSFDVLFYRAETGLWEQYLAGDWVELPVEGENNNTGYGVDDKWDDGHPRYHFYCTLNNNEQASATVVFESEAINCANGEGKYNYHDNYGYTGDWVTETITGEELYQRLEYRNDRVVYNDASNHKNDNDNPNDATNKDRRVNLTSLHGDHVEKYTDVVGRIGNLAITSTTDIRFMNFFKRPQENGTYLINGIVKEVYEDIQRDYLSWHYNNGSLAYDVRHRQVARDTGMYNTWGSSIWKGSSKCGVDSNAKEQDTQGKIDDEYELNGSTNIDCNSHAADVVAGHDITAKDPLSSPLSSDRNNIEIYQKELIKPGYTINYEITTTGNYQNRVQVKPYFYALDLKNNRLLPVDVYMKTDDEYKGINFFGATDGLPITWSDGTTSQLTDDSIQESLNNYVLSIDWKNEAKLRMYTAMEKELTEAISRNYIEYRTDDEYGNEIVDINNGGNPNKEPVRIPSGDFFKLGNLQAQIIGNQARTFLGTRYTMYENFRHSNGANGMFTTDVLDKLHDTNLWDLADNLDYTYRAQRWHLKLGLPSSAVFTLVENGVHYKPLEEKMVNGEKIKAFEELQSGNYAIVMTANIKSIGDVWNLYYTQEANNGVFKIGDKQYRIDSDLYQNTTGNPADSQVVLAIYDSNTTSEVDVDTIGTH